MNGRAEVLLTPGIFLRTDDNSTVEMVNPGLADTVAALKRGRALVEVNEIRKENNIRVHMGNASTQLLKTGLYDFDMERGLIRVFDGKALLQLNDQQLSVHSGHEVNLNATNKKLKETKFDKKASEDDFYRWASLRSSYLAEANVDAARRYVVGGGGPGWYGTGWYWDPWFNAYTFLPADGFFFNPFGWGFYSPLYVYGAPYFGYGGYYHRFGPGYHPPFVTGTRGFRGPVRGFGGGSPGGFRVSPGPSFHGGGGFHSAGGFRGGGFGGRR